MPDEQVPAKQSQAEDVLIGEPLTLGYRGYISPGAYFWNSDGSPVLNILGDIETMLLHPQVHLAGDYYKSGISEAEFEFRASSSTVEAFAQAELERFWSRALDECQKTYEYGWGGYEVSYCMERGYLRFDYLTPFWPGHTHVLTQGHLYDGIRVRQIEGKGYVDLWAADKWPAKGFWLAHRRRYNRWYGRTQYQGCWRPWRLLAGRDAAEEVTATAIYRFGVAGPEIRYPPKGFKNKDGNIDFQQAREKCREWAENAKAGMSFAAPNTWNKDAGDYEFVFKWPDHTIQVDGLINYEKRLEDLISKGIGVPPELLEAAETGSGFSGRKIPLDSYLAGQRKNAREIVMDWKEQIGDPLVKWNFGQDAWFEVDVKSLLQTHTQSAEGQEPGGAPQPGANAAGAWTPYQGARGGQGEKNAATGAIRYNGSQLALDASGHAHKPGGTAEGGQFTSGGGGANGAASKPAVSKENKKLKRKAEQEFRNTEEAWSESWTFLPTLYNDEDTPKWGQMAYHVDDAYDSTGLSTEDRIIKYKRALAAVSAWAAQLSGAKVKEDDQESHDETVSGLRQVALGLKRGLSKLHEIQGMEQGSELALDASGHAHKPAGTAEGGQFTTKWTPENLKKLTGKTVYSRDGGLYKVIEENGEWRIGHNKGLDAWSAAELLNEMEADLPAELFEEDDDETPRKKKDEGLATRPKAFKAEWSERIKQRGLFSSPEESSGRQTKLFAIDAADTSGRWITIGAVEMDGKKRGGTPVFINDDGQIVKGPRQLLGHKPENLSEAKRSEEDKKPRTEKQHYSREARKAGLRPAEVHWRAAEIRKLDNEFADKVSSMLRDVRQEFQRSGGKRLTKALKAFNGGDYGEIPGFDSLARSMAERYPDLLGAHGYSSEGGYDENATEANEKLFQWIAAGVPSKLTIREAYKKALRIVQPSKRKEKVRDEVPF